MTGATASPTVLGVRALRIGFPGHPVREVPDFTLGPGTVLAVLGANAAGKSTLLRTLAGLVAPLSGHVEIDGTPMHALDRGALARRVAFLPQSQAPLAMTVLEAVMLGRAPHVPSFARPGEVDAQIAWRALEAVGLDPLARRSLETLSGGQRQLAAVARVLVQGAGLILFDEPTTGLDFGNQAVVLDSIARVRAMGLSVIFTTHDPRHAADCADRLLILDLEGACELSPPGQALDPARLRRIYGVDVRI